MVRTENEWKKDGEMMGRDGGLWEKWEKGGGDGGKMVGWKKGWQKGEEDWETSEMILEDGGMGQMIGERGRRWDIGG